MINKYLTHLVKTAENNYLSNLKDKISKFKCHSFVDVGCYDGKYTKIMGDAVGAREIYGIELDDDAITIAKNTGIVVIKQDLSSKNWQIPHDKFDMVYCNQVIEHLYSVDEFVKNVKHILKPNGYFVVSTENLAAWHNVFALSLGYQPFSSTNICTKKWSIGNPFSRIDTDKTDQLMIHRSVFTYYSLYEFLKLYGFQVVETVCSGYYPFPNNAIGNFFATIDKRHSVYIAFILKKID